MGALDSDQVQAWIHAARAGDDEALRELIAASMEYLFPVALRLLSERHSQGSYLSDALHSCGSDLSERMRDDAWEITHAACCRMATKLHSFRGRNAFGRSVQFSTWLYAIARNEMRNILRGRWREAKRRSLFHRMESYESEADERRLPGARPDASLEKESPTPEETFMQQVDRRLMQEALRNAPLTPEQKEAIQLYYGLGYKQERIAAITGVQVGTVKKRLFDGLRKLRTYVQERSDAPPKREGSA